MEGNVPEALAICPVAPPKFTTVMAPAAPGAKRNSQMTLQGQSIVGVLRHSDDKHSVVQPWEKYPHLACHGDHRTTRPQHSLEAEGLSEWDPPARSSKGRSGVEK